MPFCRKNANAKCGNGLAHRKTSYTIKIQCHKWLVHHLHDEMYQRVPLMLRYPDYKNAILNGPIQLVRGSFIWNPSPNIHIYVLAHYILASQIHLLHLILCFELEIKSKMYGYGTIHFAFVLPHVCCYIYANVVYMCV